MNALRRHQLPPPHNIETDRYDSECYYEEEEARLSPYPPLLLPELITVYTYTFINHLYL